MLEITESVLTSIIKATEDCSVEQGFILGCTSRLDRIDVCKQIPAVQAGLYFYSPDTEAATKAVRRWAEQEICFCGFIHTHRTDKKELSEPDIRFAKELFSSFEMPYLWFGLLVITEEEKEIMFYRLYSKEGETLLELMNFCKSTEEREGIFYEYD